MFGRSSALYRKKPKTQTGLSLFLNNGGNILIIIEMLITPCRFSEMRIEVMTS